MRLDRAFFEKPTLEVAQKLIGKTLVFKNYEGIITETEAYIGKDDPACHAARGKTPRNEVMFGKCGFSYVYFIYGMYHCLNVVTEKEGFPSAVLIRGLLLKDEHLNGPGKLCKKLGISRDHNKIDLIMSTDFYIEDRGVVMPYESTPRVGISQGKEKPWRFVVK